MSVTPARYAIFRVLLGSYLLVHFLHLLPWSTELFSAAGMIADGRASPLLGIIPSPLQFSDAPWMVLLLVGSAATASVAFMLGRHDRAAAAWIGLVLLWLFARNPLIANPALPYVGWMLLAHLFVPPLDRPGWRLPTAIFAAASVVLAISYSYSGYTKLLSPSWVAGFTVEYVLLNPLARDHALRETLLAVPPLLQGLTWLILYVELLYAPLALVPRLRPWLWGIMAGVQLGFLVLLDFADLTVPMLLMHLLSWDSRWVRLGDPTRRYWLLFDGDCGFCHRVVRFVAGEDAAARYHYAPLGSPAARALAGDRGLDSFLIVAPGGVVAQRGQAVRQMLAGLGGGWWAASQLLRPVPDALLDRLYDWIGRRRYRWSGRTAGLCPLPSAQAPGRFFLDLPASWRR